MPNLPDPEPVCTRTAAASGDAEAQFALAFTLAAAPAQQDYAAAMEWYRKAADQDHHLAQFNLGQMFAHGQGMPMNDSMALMWIGRAAQGGDIGAQYEMGERIVRAGAQDKELDASESRVEAYKWFTLAAAQNYRDAQFRADSATMRMTREEVTEGNRRVKMFTTA